MYVFSYLRKFHQKRALKNKSMLVLDGIMKPFWLRTGELGLAPHPSPPAREPSHPAGRVVVASRSRPSQADKGSVPEESPCFPWEATATNGHQWPRK